VPESRSNCGGIYSAAAAGRRPHCLPWRLRDIRAQPSLRRTFARSRYSVPPSSGGAAAHIPAPMQPKGHAVPATQLPVASQL
jgi:hypothetical protein